jgi:hypothetical protein
MLSTRLAWFELEGELRFGVVVGCERMTVVTMEKSLAERL